MEENLNVEQQEEVVPKKKFNKRKAIKIILLILFIAIVTIAVVVFSNATPLDIDDIYFAMTKDNEKTYTLTEEFEQTIFNNGLVKKLDFKIKLENGSEETATIELFDNRKNAQMKKEIVMYYNEKIDTLSNEERENIDIIGRQNVYQRRNVVLIIPDTVSEVQIDSLRKAFFETVGNNEIVVSTLASRVVSEGNAHLVIDQYFENKIENIDEDKKENTVSTESSSSNGGTTNTSPSNSSASSSSTTSTKPSSSSTSNENTTTRPNNSSTGTSNTSSTSNSSTSGGSTSTEPNDSSSESTTTVTTGQRNAVKKAKEYLSVMPFSREGLIAQLEYEKFSNVEATYGVDNCGANWNEQALKQAKKYLSVMAFSREGLISQLEYDKFTGSQAVYGVNNCGTNWNEQAAKKAKEYLNVMSFSRDGLISQLQFDGFTYEQAVYGAEANGL